MKKLWKVFICLFHKKTFCITELITYSETAKTSKLITDLNENENFIENEIEHFHENELKESEFIQKYRFEPNKKSKFKRVESIGEMANNEKKNFFKRCGHHVGVK